MFATAVSNVALGIRDRLFSAHVNDLKKEHFSQR